MSTHDELDPSAVHTGYLPSDRTFQSPAHAGTEIDPALESIRETIRKLARVQSDLGTLIGINLVLNLILIILIVLGGIPT